MSSDKSLTDDEVLVKELMIITIDNLVKEHLNLDSKADLVPILRIIMAWMSTRLPRRNCRCT